MAITTLDQVISGLLPTYTLYRVVNRSNNDPNIQYSMFSPGGGAAPTSASGNILLNTDAGAIPFVNPVSGNTYLAGVKISPMSNFTFASKVGWVVDRLWHGILASTTSPQTVNSVTFPSRDNNGTTNGDGVYLAFEVGSIAASGASWNATVTYTNSSGTAGRTANVLYPYSMTTLRENRWFPIRLQAGDTGVQSVQDVTFTAAISPSINIVAYRTLTQVYCQTTSDGTGVADVVSLAMPRVYDGSYLTFVLGSYLNGQANVAASFEVTLTQG